MKNLRNKLSCILCTLLFSGVFIACTVDSDQVHRQTIQSKVGGAGITILTIDQCEYVLVRRRLVLRVTTYGYEVLPRTHF